MEASVNGTVFTDSQFEVIRAPDYSDWPFATLTQQQRDARHALELRLRTSKPKIPTVFGELHDEPR